VLQASDVAERGLSAALQLFPHPRPRILTSTIPVIFGEVRFLHLTDAKVADTPQDIPSICDPHSPARSQIPSTPLSPFATTQTCLQKTLSPATPKRLSLQPNHYLQSGIAAPLFL